MILPLLGIIETPDSEPETIEEAVQLQEKKKAEKRLKSSSSGGAPESAVPAE